MTLQELKQQYELHNVASPHTEEKCEICKKWKERFKDLAKDVNGNNF